MSAKNERPDPIHPFTVMEKLCVALIGRGENYRTAADRLHIKPATVKYHAANAAAKLPGDLPPQTKILFWARGATLEQMVGDLSAMPSSPSKMIMRETKELRGGGRQPLGRARLKEEAAKDTVEEPAEDDGYPIY